MWFSRFVAVAAIVGFSWSAYGQTSPFGPRRLVADMEPVEILDLITVDVDGDDFVDIVIIKPGTHTGDPWWMRVDRLLLYPNTNGFEIPNQVQLIALSQESAPAAGETGTIFERVEAGDFDGDGDQDLVVEKTYGGWWCGERFLQYFGHVDGTLGFAPGDTLATTGSCSEGGVAWYSLRDFDGDGQVELAWQLEGCSFDGPCSGHELEVRESNGEVWSGAETRSMNGQFVRWAIDIDTDGDLDLITVPWPGDHRVNQVIGWAENIGGRAFEYHALLDLGDEYRMELFPPADMDGDGRTDVVGMRYGATAYDPRLVWLRNLGGGVGLDPTPRLVDDSPTGYPTWAVAADVDSDGDSDLVVNSTHQPDQLDALIYYENLGGGSFDGPRTIDGLLESFWIQQRGLWLADLNSDGVVDLLTIERGPSWAPTRIIWYPNILSVGVDDAPGTIPNTFTVYPNPSASEVTVRYTVSSRSNVELRVVDILGRQQLVYTMGPQTAGEHTVPLDLSSVAPGVYFVTLQAGSFLSTQKVVLLR